MFNNSLCSSAHFFFSNNLFKKQMILDIQKSLENNNAMHPCMQNII